MWQALTPISTVKVGRALWMTLIPHDFMTPKGIETVPAGFLFDHASVPRMFSNIVPPVKSCLAEASLLHDWYYCKDSTDVPRKFADEGLKKITLSTAKMANKSDKNIAILEIVDSWQDTRIKENSEKICKMENRGVKL